jgi:hypothetical protein
VTAVRARARSAEQSSRNLTAEPTDYR